MNKQYKLVATLGEASTFAKISISEADAVMERVEENSLALIQAAITMVKRRGLKGDKGRIWNEGQMKLLDPEGEVVWEYDPSLARPSASARPAKGTKKPAKRPAKKLTKTG